MYLLRYGEWEFEAQVFSILKGIYLYKFVLMACCCGDGGYDGDDDDEGGDDDDDDRDDDVMMGMLIEMEIS